MHREPSRCLKCQCLNTNHLAARCMCKETCGTCGGEHRMAECTETDHDRFWCTNCNTSGNALGTAFSPGSSRRAGEWKAQIWNTCTSTSLTRKHGCGNR